MCGIIAYIRNVINTSKDVKDVLIKGLERLEYRGYDSAGISILQTNPYKINIIKRKGKVENLKKDLVAFNSDEVHIGIGHTRWATHGPPNTVNAHPHTNKSETISLVHNGIIENYEELRHFLIKKNFEIKSDTDTEIICHLLEYNLLQSKLNFIDALQLTLSKLEGSFALVIMSTLCPNSLIATRKSSPLLLGVGDNEFILASDASAIVEHTKKVIYLKDNEIAIVNQNNSYQITNSQNQNINKEITILTMEIDEIEKSGYKHFMLKEIMEQPKAIKKCIQGRFLKDTTILGGLSKIENKIKSCNQIAICACGTSWHSALVGKYIIEKFVRISVQVDYASEYRYRNPVTHPNDILIVISQSGETADTLAALESAKEKGITTMGICNVVGSTIAREADAGMYLHIGPEIGVASTKAFTGQILCLIMFALHLGKIKGIITKDEMKEHIENIEKIPDTVSNILKLSEQIKEISKNFRFASNFIYLGRGFNYPVALEGALKLKEISYIHAEGYPAAEMKHGPIALIDNNMPVIFIAQKQDPIYLKIKANIDEVRARNGTLIIITNTDNNDFDLVSEFIIKIPYINEYISPILNVVPLQLLSYFIADMRGCHIDQPKNLAKSVTVE